MLESWDTRVLKLSSCFVTQGRPWDAIEWGAAQVRCVDFARLHVALDDVFEPSDRPALWAFPRSQLPKEDLLRDRQTHTDRQSETDTLIAIFRPPIGGGVIMKFQQCADTHRHRVSLNDLDQQEETGNRNTFNFCLLNLFIYVVLGYHIRRWNKAVYNVLGICRD